MKIREALARPLAGMLGIAALLAGASEAVAQTTTSATTVPGSTAQNVYYTPDPTRFRLLSVSGDLRTGDTGEAVGELQGLLAELGYLDIAPAETPLGYYGPLTSSALMRYQEALGVPATGIFDAATRTALNLHLESRGWLDNIISQNGAATTTTQTVAQVGNTGTSGSGTSGYWLNGNFYNAPPIIATTTASRSAAPNEYWFNGMWYRTTQDSQDPVAVANVGYWLDGNFYNAQPQITDLATTSSSDIGTGEGYWYNGLWFDTGNVSGVSEDIRTGEDS